MTAPSIDFKGICDALAARFDAATIGTPTGAPAIRDSFGQMPKGTLVAPFVVVEPTEGTVTANDQWQHVMDLDVILHLSKRPGDPARVEAQRQLWLPYLLFATERQMKLGIGAKTGYEVAKALPVGWKWDEHDVAGVEYDAIRVHYRVWVYETVDLLP